MKRKTEQKLEAIKLRKQGHSLKEIVESLNVAKSSASVWVRNVPLSLQAKVILAAKIGQGRMKGAEARRQVSITAVDNARKIARALLSGLPRHKAVDALACALMYYCEGAKGVSSGVRFTNSSPALMARFIDLFEKSFSIDRSRIRIGLHLHEYHQPEKQRQFWSQVTGVPNTQFIRPYLKPHTGKQIREGYPGCATFYHPGANIARQLIAIAEEYLTGA